MKDKEINQKFLFNDRTKTLSVITLRETEGCSMNYADEFNEKQIIELYKSMVKDKDKMEMNIQMVEKDIDNYKEQINNNKIVLTDKQIELKENLLLLQKYKPIDDAVVREKESKDMIKGLNEQLKEKRKIINEIRTKCKGLKL